MANTPTDTTDDRDREWLACATCNDKAIAEQLPGWEPGWDSEPACCAAPATPPCAICGTTPANGMNYPVTQTHTA